MLDVDEGGEAAAALGLGDDAQTESGFAGGFRPVDFILVPALNPYLADGVGEEGV